MSMKYSKITIIVLAYMISAGELIAQKPVQMPNDSLAQVVAKMNKTVQDLEKIKISGYIQAQYQIADTLGAKSFNGGDFAAASSQRFMVRRGYLKIAYAGNLATYVLQVNVNDKGFSVRDAYVSIKEPWLKAFNLTGGIFYRPFGNELSFSTSQRESPEVSRLTQLMFPGERDLGASITFQMPEKSPLHLIKAEAGLFSGNGTSSETDDKLDFIGRIGIADASKKHKISYGLGVSYYNGSIYQAKKEVYKIGNVEGILAFHQLAADTIPGNYFKRRYLGLDGQFSFQTVAGRTTFRGDFMTGDQPGSDKSSSSPAAAIDYSLFLRKFEGGAFFLIQTIPGNMHSIVLKYDFYDPNTDLRGDEIGKKTTTAKATNSTDIAYTTWGFGWITDFNQNLRLVLYYDLVKNETSKNLAGFSKDQKDNIFTVRIQYKF
jgi:hypothetical protein